MRPNLLNTRSRLVHAAAPDGEIATACGKQLRITKRTMDFCWEVTTRPVECAECKRVLAAYERHLSGEAR